MVLNKMIAGRKWLAFALGLCPLSQCISTLPLETAVWISQALPFANFYENIDFPKVSLQLWCLVSAISQQVYCRKGRKAPINPTLKSNLKFCSKNCLKRSGIDSSLFSSLPCVGLIVSNKKAKSITDATYSSFFQRSIATNAILTKSYEWSVILSGQSSIVRYSCMGWGGVGGIASCWTLALLPSISIIIIQK